MNHISPPHPLKRAKAALPGPPRLIEALKTSAQEPERPISFRRVLQIFLKSPWDDYDSFPLLDQGILAKHKSLYFKVVNITPFDCDDGLEQIQNLSRIQHPNVASIHGVYCYDGQFSLITEHLEVSMSQLDVGNYHLQEWEIATIIFEVGNLGHKWFVSISDSVRFSRVLRISLPWDSLVRNSHTSIFGYLWMAT